MITKLPKIHLIVKKERKYRYLCIGACEPSKYKSTKLKENVTCRNCKKILKNGNF